MTNADLGVYGAKRQSWIGPGPRAILLKLRKKHKTADVEQLAELMMQEVSINDQLAIFVYWVTRNLISIEPYTNERHRFKTSAAHINKTVHDRVQAVAKKLTLSFVMPNDKPLGECTGTYCSEIGGVFALIGERVGTKKVSDVMSNKDISNIR